MRESVFNALVSMGVVDGAQVIDAYAGSGALGIEALSRGAAHVIFVEADAAARSVVSANLEVTDLTSQATVTGGDGGRIAAAGGPWDLVLLDPPYAFDEWDGLLVGLAGALAPDGVVVVESNREVALPAGLVVIRTKHYGSTVVTFATPAGAAS